MTKFQLKFNNFDHVPTLIHDLLNRPDDLDVRSSEAMVAEAYSSELLRLLQTQIIFQN